ncbi:MAG: hypothetical protein WDA60_10865, partial [Acidimicrobiia bacterium]
MWKTPRTVMVAGVALVAGLGVGAAVVPALAAQEPVLSQEQQSQLQSQVDAYKACLEQQGVTLPEKPADGSKPELTDEQKAAMKAAHDACESQRPSRPELTDEQKATLQAQVQEHRSCMETQLGAAGITMPQKPVDGTQTAPPADGQRPQRPQLTDEQKAAFEAARTACADVAPNLGVEGIGPMGHGHGGPGGMGGPGGRFGGPGGRGGPQG